MHDVEKTLVFLTLFNGAKTRMRTELCLIKPVELKHISVGQSFHVWINYGGLFHNLGPPISFLCIF